MLELFPTQLENVEGAVQRLLLDNWAEARALVEGAHPEDDLALVPPVEWHMGNLPDADTVFTFIQALPAATVEVIDLVPLPGSETLGAATCIVTVFVQGDNVDAANKAAHRYAALLATIMWECKAAGVNKTTEMQLDVSPTIQGGYGQLTKGARVQQTLWLPAMLL